MPDYIRAFVERAAESKPGDAIRFVASTSDVARDGMVVEAEGWQLDNFRKNPVFLWAHNYSEPPIGRVENVSVEGDKLIADVVFDQEDANALRIERKYRSGILSAVSVGFNIVEYKPSDGKVAPRATKTELLELSGVPVPADPGALAERQRQFYRSLGTELLGITDADDDDKPTANTDENTAPPADQSVRASWDETSAAMVELFRPYGQRSDDDRRADYDRLAREYARLRRTPPEFASNAELEAYDADALRGRFLEGEPDLYPSVFAAMTSRAGAILSRQNRDDLAQAAALITSVLERATKEADEAAAGEENRAVEAKLRALLNKLPPTE